MFISEIPLAFIALAIVNSIAVIEQVPYGVILMTALEDHVRI